MTLVTLRPATPDDASQLARILTGWITETLWMSRLHSDAGTEAFLTRQIADTSVIVLCDGAMPQGFLARAGEEITCLYLSAEARGRGHGARLLEDAKTAQPRLQLWTFQANAAARRFYARNGFAEIARTDGAANDENLPDVQLEWTRR
ncbi:N-acetyltransferase [Rhodophyticola sp. CCM32]|uniref:GNAT family N-acetyltransferase n=1 Tax=Rhodophyticola sp. CCM32 TaxID=2916397 RepID=UPI00107F3DAA|nr:GNAT family N-acetyltransferase [Rhodophyticola sp. CCM32]QBY00848.1 N-acetyltransferase [Rhodophyticola sp. CCM32]